MAIGVNVTHVPYRGDGPALQDLIGGRIDYMCATIQTGAALAKQGTVKGHRRDVGASRRRSFPIWRPPREQGLPGVEASVWNAFFLPPRAPPADRREAQQGDERYARDPACASGSRSSASRSSPPERRTPEYLAKFLADEVARWGKVVRDAGISAD